MAHCRREADQARADAADFRQFRAASGSPDWEQMARRCDQIAAAYDLVADTEEEVAALEEDVPRLRLVEPPAPPKVTDLGQNEGRGSAESITSTPFRS